MSSQKYEKSMKILVNKIGNQGIKREIKSKNFRIN